MITICLVLLYILSVYIAYAIMRLFFKNSFNFEFDGILVATFWPIVLLMLIIFFPFKLIDHWFK